MCLNFHMYPPGLLFFMAIMKTSMENIPIILLDLVGA